jgi:hypothetical protein
VINTALNYNKLQNAKSGFEHLKERILIESIECNPRIVITAEGFGHQTEVLNNLLEGNEKERSYYFHENAKTNAQAHRNLKACDCMKKG